MQFLPLVKGTLNRQFVRKVILNICISSFYAGYTLTYFNAIDFDQTMRFFAIPYPRAFSLAFLSFIVIIFSAVGACLSAILQRAYSVRQIILYINFAAIFALLLLQIPNVYTLALTRIIQGITIGIVFSVVPSYIREFCPQSSLAQIIVYYSFTFCMGLATSFLWVVILSYFAQQQSVWRLLYGLPLIILPVQAWNLIYNYPFETLHYLIRHQRNKQVKQILKLMYRVQSETDSNVKNKSGLLNEEINKQMCVKFRRDKSNLSQKEIAREQQQTQQNEYAASQSLFQPYIEYQFQELKKGISGKAGCLKQRPSSKLAIFIAIHLMIMQHMTGMQPLIIYGVEIFKDISTSSKQIFPILLNYQAAIVVYFSRFVYRYAGRKTILVWGSAACSLLTAVIGIMFLDIEHQYAKIILVGNIFLFRAVFMLTLGHGVSLYVSEIVGPDWIAVAVMMNQLASGATTFVYPIAVQYFGNPANLFFIYSLYCFGGLIINFLVLVETDGKSEIQLQKQFLEKQKYILKRISC